MTPAQVADLRRRLAAAEPTTRLAAALATPSPGGQDSTLLPVGPSSPAGTPSPVGEEGGAS